MGSTVARPAWCVLSTTSRFAAEPNTLRRHKSVEHRRKSLGSGRGSLGSGQPSSLQHAITEPTPTIQVQAAVCGFQWQSSAPVRWCNA